MKKNSFGEYLRELRGKDSLREAAEKTNLSHTYIRDLELGNKTDPSHDTLAKIAKAYGVSYGELSSKKFHAIDHPEWIKKFGPINKTPIETLAYFDLFDQEGNIRDEFLEEIIILINRYGLNVPIQDNGSITYDEFLKALEVKGSIVIDEVRSELEDMVFESFRNQDDLVNILKREEITYKGHSITEAHRQLITAYLDALFPDRES